MKRHILTLLTLLSMATTSAYAQAKGTIVTQTIESKVLLDNKVGLDARRSVKVYLPPSYTTSNGRRYPVVYYCHNIFWGPEQMIKEGYAVALLDRAMDKKLTKEFIMVIADYRGPGIGSLYENSSTSGRWLDFTTSELVPFIDNNFRTIRSSGSRAVVGDFMGGRGALRLAMSDPDLFGSVYALHPVATGNGSLPWAALNINWEKIASTQKFEDLFGPDRTAIFVAIHQAFLPNPNRPPFYCDFSIEIEEGKRVIKPEKMAQAKKNFLLDEDLLACADNLRKLRGIALDWGRYDETRAHVESNRDFSSKLEDLDIPHVAEEYNGTPFNKMWTDGGRFYTRVIPFLNHHLAFEP